jgi:integrase
LRWHDLRHTAASLSLAVTPNLHLVKERLGHEDIRTTINTYGHLLPSVEAALADGLGALFAAAVQPAAPVTVLRTAGIVR